MMAGVIDSLIQKVEKCIENQSRIEAHIVRMDRRSNETYQQAADRTVQKAFAHSGGTAMAGIGFNGDGNDLLGLLRYTGGKQKAIGWGSMLKDMNEMADPRSDHAALNSRIEKAYGARKVKALAEQTGTGGGYTVPVQYYADLMRLLGEESFTRKLATILPMQSRTMYVPAVDQSITPAVGTAAWWGGIQATFQPEAQSISNSQPSFRQLELTARDLVFTCTASNQLMQDNAVGLDTVLTTMFQEAMGWFFDWFMLRGTGVNQPLGTLNAPAAVTTGGNAGQTSRITAGQVNIADLANMMSHLVLSSWKNAVWVCHPSVLGQLIRMTSATDNASPISNLVWLNPFGNGGNANEGPVSLASPFSILGRPVYFSEKVPNLGTTGDVQLVDFSKMLVGDRLAVQIETSNQFLFQTNQVIWRIIQRWDAQPWLNNSIILGDGGQSYRVSTIVLLGGS